MLSRRAGPRRIRLRLIQGRKKTPSAMTAPCPPIRNLPRLGIRSVAMLLVVTVRVEFAGLPLGVTVVGENEAVAPTGRPEIDSVMMLENAPPTGVRVIGYCALI